MWEQVFRHLAADADNEYAMIDATIIRAHQHAAGAKGGTQFDGMPWPLRGGLSTKLHATCECPGQSDQLSSHARAKPRTSLKRG